MPERLTFTYCFNIIDKVVTTLFIIYFLHYIFLGLVFGNETTVSITVFGLALLLTSMLVVKKAPFITTRIVGFVSAMSLVYDDLTHGGINIDWRTLLYVPVIISTLFGLWTIFITTWNSKHYDDTV